MWKCWFWNNNENEIECVEKEKAEENIGRFAEADLASLQDQAHGQVQPRSTGALTKFIFCSHAAVAGSTTSMSSSPPYSDDASLFVSMIANLIPSKAYIYLFYRMSTPETLDITDKGFGNLGPISLSTFPLAQCSWSIWLTGNMGNFTDDLIFSPLLYGSLPRATSVPSPLLLLSGWNHRHHHRHHLPGFDLVCQPTLCKKRDEIMIICYKLTTPARMQCTGSPRGSRRVERHCPSQTPMEPAPSA